MHKKVVNDMETVLNGVIRAVLILMTPLLSEFGDDIRGCQKTRGGSGQVAYKGLCGHTLLGSRKQGHGSAAFIAWFACGCALRFVPL